jgi:hypothetical protein
MKIAIRCLTIALLVLAVVSTGAAKKKHESLSTVNFVVVRDENGKPIRNAAVVLHPVGDDGKQERAGYELKTDPEGKTGYDGVPYGKLRIQVLAHGFQTFGQDYDVNTANLDITIKMKRPAGQYSIYEEHPEEKKDDKAEEKKPQ